MSKSNSTLTQERLLKVLRYDPATGVFTWIGPMHGRKDGDRAGRLGSDGYITIKVFGRSYKAHRLAYLYTHGYWPLGDIDHINRVRVDNRIENLRDVSRTENTQNVTRAKSTSTSGLIGAHIRKKTGTWSSQISVNGSVVRLGVFATAEQAHAAYMSAKRLVHAGYVEST